MPLDERPEPFAKSPRLCRHSIEFPGDSALLKAGTYRRGNQANGGEPRQQILARLDPLHRSVDGCRDRIEKIEGARVRNEKRRGPLVVCRPESPVFPPHTLVYVTPMSVETAVQPSRECFVTDYNGSLRLVDLKALMLTMMATPYLVAALA